MENLEKVKKFSETINLIKSEIHKDVVGQEEIVDNVIIAIISGGNVIQSIKTMRITKCSIV